MYCDCLLTGLWRYKSHFSNQAVFSTWPRSQDRDLNILQTKRAFKMKQKVFFFITSKGLSLKQIKQFFWKVKVRLWVFWILNHESRTSNFFFSFYYIFYVFIVRWCSQIVKATNVLNFEKLWNVRYFAQCIFQDLPLGEKKPVFEQ